MLVGFVGAGINFSLRRRHNGHDCVSNHQPRHCLLNRLFGRRSKKTPKLHATGLCAGNSPVTGELPAQMASNAENVSIWWRHHGMRPANERLRYNVTSSLIGWVHARNDSCLCPVGNRSFAQIVGVSADKNINIFIFRTFAFPPVNTFHMLLATKP